MNSSEQIAHIRTLGKIRSAKHYDLNKDAINQKRRERYALKHGLTQPPIQTPVLPVLPPVLPPIQTPVLTPVPVQPIPVPPASIKKGKKTIQSKNVLSLAIVQQKIKDLNIENKKTEKKYVADVKRLMDMTQCNDLNECLKKPKKIIELVNNSKKRNGENYSENTKKSVYQTILYVIDKLKLDIDKTLYMKQFEVKKIISTEQNNDKTHHEEVPSFDEYVKKCKKTFGGNSKEFLVAKFYDELTVRDDFGLIITDKPLDKTNYLLVKPKSIEVVINNYKTDKKHGVISHKLSKGLEKLTRAYITTNHLGMGDFLFGSEHLSAFVSKMNKTMGYTGGVGLFRHMKITEQSENSTPEQRVELANAMAHSPVVQTKYLRKKK